MKDKIFQGVSACFAWASILELYFVLWQIKYDGTSEPRLVLLAAGLVVFIASIFAIGATKKRIKSP